jgi:LPS export ABC transporter protein LptC
MKPQRQGSDKDYMSQKKYRRIIPLFISGIILFSIGCKSDMEKVNAFASELNLPDQSARNLSVEYTDTGKLQMKFTTPVLEYYANVEEPYYEFPSGIEVFFYDENEEVKSTITSKYSIMNDKTKIWEARDSVVAKNAQTGETLETDQLFWDQTKQIIYSKVFTKITNEDGIYYGEQGFEAAQDLSQYRLLGSSGTVRVQDDE